MNRYRSAKQPVDRRKRLSHLWGRRFRLPPFFFTLAVLATAADWPQFRGPSASGVGSGSKPPIHWDAAKGPNVVWKAEIPESSQASPSPGAKHWFAIAEKL